MLTEVSEPLSLSDAWPANVTVCGDGTEGCNKLLCQLHPELQHTPPASTCLLVWHDKVLHEVRIVDAEFDTVEEDAAIGTEGFSADAVVLQDVVRQVHSSHVVLVVMQERWGRNIDCTIGSTTSNGAFLVWSISRILRCVGGGEEVHFLAVVPALGQHVTTAQVVGRSSNMASPREVDLLWVANSSLPHCPTCHTEHFGNDSSYHKFRQRTCVNN